MGLSLVLRSCARINFSLLPAIRTVLVNNWSGFLVHFWKGEQSVNALTPVGEPDGLEVILHMNRLNNSAFNIIVG